MALLTIDPRRLAAATLTALIEEFVTRDGTDYGSVEIPLERKVDQVRRQLLAGTARILYDEASQSCHIVPEETFRKMD